MVVESRDKTPGTVATMHIGKLSLVDLAGSERCLANNGVVTVSTERDREEIVPRVSRQMRFLW